MATHRRTGLSRAFAGSVSERVVADGGRPVLLLKADGKRLDQIGTLLVLSMAPRVEPWGWARRSGLPEQPAHT
jgi:hypothetical protein